jgi:hypothetical protein
MSRMKDCYGSGHEAHWQMDVTQASAIKSRVYEDSHHEEWCLDAGMDDESTNGQPVVINKVSLLAEIDLVLTLKCNVGLYYQTWQYTHNHLIVFDKTRGLDLHRQCSSRLKAWIGLTDSCRHDRRRVRSELGRKLLLVLPEKY